MQKNNREKEWKSTVKASENKKIVNFDDDINNLNSDDSFKPIDETEEKVPLTEEEKLEVRKKLFVLLIIIVVVLIFMLVVLIFDPFNSSSSNDSENEEESVEEIQEEMVVEDTLKTREDGEISLTDEEVSSLIDEITFKNNEYYDNDTISLFSSNNNAINSLTDTNKLFLMTKTSDFNNLIGDNVVNSICDSSVEINITDINMILLNRFNTTVTSYESFVYSYYIDNSFVSNIKFVYDNTTNKYIGTCYTVSSSVTNLSEIEVYKAEKKGDYLYLYSYVVFINETGVYKDTTFKSLITNDENATSSDYMSSGNTYIYTYNISGDNYYLESINLSS